MTIDPPKHVDTAIIELTPHGKRKRKGRKFQGRQCFAGHNGIRYAVGGACVQCVREAAGLRYQANRSTEETFRILEGRPSKAQRDSGMQALIDEAAPLLRQAGALLNRAGELTRRGVWWAALQRHGVTPKLAQEARRYAQQFTESDDWLAVP